jgi:hypothetical protein
VGCLLGPKTTDGQNKGVLARSDDTGKDFFGRSISNRTKKQLGLFDDAKTVEVDVGGRTINVQIVEGLKKSQIKVNDLGRLQAATGHEYTMLRGARGERVLIRGKLNEVAIPNKYIEKGYKWSGHSHPFKTIPSAEDRSVLRAFGQEKSPIIHAGGGKHGMVTPYEDLSGWTP